MKHHLSRRFALRDRTAAAHAELDAAVGALASRAAYRRYLAGIHAFRSVAEPFLTRAPWRPEPLASLLATDMEDLAVVPRTTVPLVVPDDASALLGLAYVLEGSAIGARLLYPQAQALGFDANRGARHLARQAEDRSAWPGFCGALEAAAPYDPAVAAAAATAAFDAALLAFADDVH